MERYGNLDLDLECDGGGVSQKAALFGGVFKRSSKSTEPSAQDCLLANGKLSKSNDSLSDNTKDKGVFKNVFKKTMKSTKEDQQQAPLSLQNPELSASSDSLESKSSKDKSSLLGGILKLPSRPGHVRRHSQDLLDFSDTDSLSENTNTKDSGGMFSGILKKTKKKAQSQEDLSAPSEISDNSNNLSVNSNTKETEGRFGGIFKKSPKTTGARAQSQEDLSAPDELSGRNDNLSENHTKSKLAGAMTKLNPFRPANKHEKQAGSDDEDPLVSSEKSSGNRQNAMVEAMSKLNPFRSANKKDTEGAETLTESEKKMEEKPKPVKSNMIQYERRERSAALLVPSRPTQGDTKGTSSHDKVKPRTEDNKDDKDMTSREKKRKSAETPAVPARPSEEELNRTARQKQNNNQQQSQSDDGDVKEKSATAKDSDNEKNPPEAKTTKEKKHKHLYPFIPRTAKDASDDEESSSKEETKAEESKEKTEAVQKTKKHSTFLSWFKDASDDEGLKDESASREKKKEEEGKEKEIQVTKPKKRHPLMPWVKDVSDDEESSSKEETKAEEGKEKTETKVKKPKKRKDASDDERLKEDEESSSREEKKEEEGKEKAETKEKKYKHLYPFIPPTAGKDASDDEKLKEGEESSSKEEMREEVSKEKTEAKVTKPKKRSPFMPRVKDASDDERLKENEESSSREEKKEEDGKEKTETKVKKPKKRNPFMPQVKAKVVQRRTQEEAEGNAETEGANRSLFDKLEDYRIEPAQSEDSEDVDLMEWWNTVEQWKDTPQNEDMTEKEEAKAFALTATKVQKGIRVFNKLFQERAESLWQHVIDLNAIADGLDKFNKNTKIAQITGGSTSAIGGIATVAGIALAPVTLGTSLIVTAVGLGVATAGGLTSAGAGISNQVNNSMDRKKVEKIVQDYQEKIADLDKCLKFIKQGIENLHRFDLIKMKNQAYNQDFPQLTSRFYEDGAMAGKAILINANEIMRFVQIANVAGSTAARAVQVASMATGVLTGLFVGMDIYFVAKDSKELKKGAKSEFAAKIREVAEQLHLGLVELNTIREELQSTSPENSTEGAAGHLDGEKKEEKENKTDEKEIKGDRKDEYDSSDEDEIDRIKKEIKKRYGNQEYV